jgi:protein O-mannosyl-transferase
MTAARAKTKPSLVAPALPFRESRWSVFLAAALLVFAGLFVYQNSFSGPFILDDLPAISENPTIDRLWPLSVPLSPPTNGQTVTGRPFVNLTLAVNYALDGLNVQGYHAVNLAIHLLAALALFGIARRTFLQPILRERFGADALFLAFVLALLWTVHPLLTECVTYMIQRAEALMGLFYLLTLYAFIRGAASPKPWPWYGASIAACLLGMACKEVMVSAPLIVLLYDRTFVARTFREALRLRWRYYAGLAATWLLLAALVLHVGNRGQSAGFYAGVDWLPYALTQFQAITHYLRLSLWPSPLILDYGNLFATGSAQGVATSPTQIAPYALFIGALIAGTIYALFRRPVLGFLGVAFFAILAPSSSVVPVVTQTIAEHRMYLPLAVVLAFAVAGLYRLLGRFALLAGLVLALVFGGLTLNRNRDYRTSVTLWTDTVAKRPDNARAHENLAIALAAENNTRSTIDAVGEFYQALHLLPDYAEAHSNLGNSLGALGRSDEAIEQYRAALKLVPGLAAAHYNLANALAGAGRLPEAVDEYTRTLQISPEFSPAHNNLANALAALGRDQEAQAHYEAALRFDSAYSTADTNYANLLLKLHQISPAQTHYQEALHLNPNDADAHAGLANAFMLLGQPYNAVVHYETALRLRPNFPEARANLALARQQAASPPAPAAP